MEVLNAELLLNNYRVTMFRSAEKVRVLHVEARSCAGLGPKRKKWRLDYDCYTPFIHAMRVARFVCGVDRHQQVCVSNTELRDLSDLMRQVAGDTL